MKLKFLTEATFSPDQLWDVAFNYGSLFGKAMGTDAFTVIYDENFFRDGNSIVGVRCINNNGEQMRFDFTVTQSGLALTGVDYWTANNHDDLTPDFTATLAPDVNVITVYKQVAGLLKGGAVGTYTYADVMAESTKHPLHNMLRESDMFALPEPEIVDPEFQLRFNFLKDELNLNDDDASQLAQRDEFDTYVKPEFGKEFLKYSMEHKTVQPETETSEVNDGTLNSTNDEYTIDTNTNTVEFNMDNIMANVENEIGTLENPFEANPESGSELFANIDNTNDETLDNPFDGIEAMDATEYDKAMEIIDDLLTDGPCADCTKMDCDNCEVLDNIEFEEDPEVLEDDIDLEKQEQSFIAPIPTPIETTAPISTEEIEELEQSEPEEVIQALDTNKNRFNFLVLVLNLDRLDAKEICTCNDFNEILPDIQDEYADFCIKESKKALKANLKEAGPSRSQRNDFLRSKGFKGSKLQDLAKEKNFDDFVKTNDLQAELDEFCVSVEKGKTDVSNDMEGAIQKAEKQFDATPFADPDLVFEELEILIDDLLITKEKTCLIITGQAGVGKTYTVNEKLTEYLGEGNYKMYKASKLTTKSFYEELYKHRNELIVFDEADSLILNKELSVMLKSALDLSGDRTISYITGNRSPRVALDGVDTSDMEFADEEEGEGDDFEDETWEQIWAETDKYISKGYQMMSGIRDAVDHKRRLVKTPAKFPFTGKLILITNLTPDKVEPALLSRGSLIDIRFTAEQMMLRCKTILRRNGASDDEIAAFEEVTERTEGMRQNPLTCRYAMKVLYSYRAQIEHGRDAATAIKNILVVAKH